MNIAIIEGFLEGPQHSKRLRRTLSVRGHKITSPDDAQLIIIHSGGWVFLPASLADKRLVFWDPVYRSHTPLAVRFLRRLIYDVTHPRPRMAIERVWNMWYLIRDFKRWIVLLKRINRDSIIPLFIRPSSFVIGAGDHSWWDDQTIEITHVSHVRTKGDHDYLWERPEELLSAARL